MKQSKIIFKGIVKEVLRSDTFRVLLENGVYITAYLSGKIRMNKVKIILGDSVQVELSPYDLTKGRIRYRL